MYICEKCGKEVTEKFGSGRFCSKQCANSRTHSSETKEKIRQSIKSNFTYVEDVNGKVITENKFKHNQNRREKSILRQKEKQQKRDSLIEEIDLKNSPYKDYDTVYLKSGSNKDCYYFTKHDNMNKIVARVIVPVYRYLVEYNLKRKLLPNEVVHHKDGNHFNNELDNLKVMTRSEHSSLHHKMSIIQNI